MEQLLELGFEPFKCERALEAAHHDVRAAVDFVLANAEQPEEWWRAAASEAAAANEAAQRAQLPSGAVTFEEADACRLCGFKFHMFARRHHCRECGRSVCYDHSLSSLPLPHRGTGDAPQRVCDECAVRERSRHARGRTSV